MLRASIYLQCFICFLYPYIASVSNACSKCFICLFFLCVASIAFICFKSRSGCCTCWNGVSIVCSSVLDVCCKGFHMDVAKVDRGVAWRGRWCHCVGRGMGAGVRLPCDGHGRRCWERDAGHKAGCGRGSSVGLEAAGKRSRTRAGEKHAGQAQQGASGWQELHATALRTCKII
jgi:hypothetical protein